MLKKHGSVEAVRDFMRNGANKSTRNLGKKGGFAADKERARKAGYLTAKKRWGYNVHTDNTSSKTEDNTEGQMG